jgi:hypothetical protein
MKTQTFSLLHHQTAEELVTVGFVDAQRQLMTVIRWSRQLSVLLKRYADDSFRPNAHGWAKPRNPPEFDLICRPKLYLF